MRVVMRWGCEGSVELGPVSVLGLHTVVVL